MHDQLLWPNASHAPSHRTRSALIVFYPSAPRRPGMAGSKSRRLAWLIQKLEETRSTNASRRDHAIRAWLRPGGIMAMIVEALALAEELDGGRWFNWVDQPGEPKRHLATFPSRAQYERVLKGKGPKYHAARKYVRYVYGRRMRGLCHAGAMWCMDGMTGRPRLPCSSSPSCTRPVVSAP